jgi:hypothetical protein
LSGSCLFLSSWISLYSSVSFSLPSWNIIPWIFLPFSWMTFRHCFFLTRSVGVQK